MTDEMMDLRSIVEKAFDADLLRSCSSRMTNGRSSAPATDLETMAALSDDPVVGLPAMVI